MEKIRILQLGEEDWNKLYTLPDTAMLDHVDVLKESPKKPYDMCFLDRDPSEEETDLLYRMVKAYTLFVTDKVDRSGRSEWLCRSRGAQYIAEDDIQRFLMEESRYYFPRPYGEKLSLKDVAVAQGFHGAVQWNGNRNILLEADFGDDFHQVAYWRYNSRSSKGEAADLWLEYDKDPSVQIRLVMTIFVSGSISDIFEQKVFSEKDLENIIRFESRKGNGMVFFSIHAKGNGRLWLTALHKRLSRGEHGYFLPGGERYVTSRREEAFCYFEPGDLKPPLNVYFSGYKTLQGFEGYHMMRGLGAPFLLLSEPRLEGGNCYIGTEEYERIYPEVIRKHMQELGFTSNQVILSGISMGSFGALYYGCDIEPHIILLGKPVASIGNLAANEKHLRPGGCPTALDFLYYQCGGMQEEDIKWLNDKFWNKFDKADWRQSKFAVAYMIEDDYDTNAYDTLLSHLGSSGVQAYGKGLHGRHNDNTPGIVDWFVGQYKKILQEDFGRRMDR